MGIFSSDDDYPAPAPLSPEEEAELGRWVMELGRNAAEFIEDMGMKIIASFFSEK